MNIRANCVLLFASACAMALTVGQACAQSTPAAAQASGQLEEVVVTATRRQERLQDVPISVTALTAKALDQQQVVDVTTLAKVVPGMQVKPTLNPLQITVAIRGVTQVLSSVAVDPSIGTYVDGVYNVLTAGSNNAMIDMERVEVLKGPQGTLFGRNTIGGAISITTAKPTDTFGGSAEAGTGDYGAWNFTGVLNGPIKSGLLDARLVYQHTEHDGYGRDLTTGNPTNSLDQDYVRGALKFTPNNNWTVLATGFYTDARGYSAASKLTYIASAFNASYPAASGHPGDLLSNYVNKGDFQNDYGDQDARFGLRQGGATVVVTGKLNDSVTFKSITGYTHTDYTQASDFDGMPYNYIQIAAFPILADQYSEELQFFGDALDGRLKWITGAYFFKVDASQINYTSVLPALVPAAARSYSANGPYVDNRSYSGFAQLNYEVASKLRLTGGLRYVVDDRDVTYLDHKVTAGAVPVYMSCHLANDVNPTTAAGGTNPAACIYKNSAKYNYIPWTVGLDYKPDNNTLVYAKVSQGFRSGAFPGAGPAAVAPSALVTAAQAVTQDAKVVQTFGPAAPEKLFSPEIGVKLDMLDHHLRINAAAYYSRYDNIQLSVNLPATCATCAPIAVLENSGTADIWGGELEAAALLGKLQLDAALGYSDPRYVSGVAVGQPIINVSKFNGSFTAAYPIALSAGDLTLSGVYAYRSQAAFYAVPAGSPAALAAAVTQKGFGLLDVHASFAFRTAPITLSAFAQNLTDQKYIVSASDFPAPINSAVAWVGSPRTYGASIKYTF